MVRGVDRPKRLGVCTSQVAKARKTGAGPACRNKKRIRNNPQLKKEKTLAHMEEG